MNQVVVGPNHVAVTKTQIRQENFPLIFTLKE